MVYYDMVYHDGKLQYKVEVTTPKPVFKMLATAAALDLEGAAPAARAPQRIHP